jgi:hypothetical protein
MYSSHVYLIDESFLKEASEYGGSDRATIASYLSREGAGLSW